MRARVLGKTGSWKLKELPLASALLNPDAWGLNLIPWPPAYQLPQSWGKSALYYQRSCLPQASGQQNPQPRAPWEVPSDPSLGSVPSSPEAVGYRLSGPHHTPPQG